MAGGGRGIERVDISVDNGKTWLEAHRLPKLQTNAYDSHRPDWAWTLWELKSVKVETPCTVIVKAVCGSSPDESVANSHAVGMFCTAVHFLLELVVVKNIWPLVRKPAKPICYCFLVDKTGVISGLLI